MKRVKKVQDLAKEKPDTQELKNAASELAESLKNASDELKLIFRKI